MTKLEFIALSISNGDYLHRAWGLSVFTVTDSKRWDLSDITGYDPESPLLVATDKVTVPGSVLPFIAKSTETTYGRIFMHAIVFWYPYGALVPFQNTLMTPSLVNSIALELLKSDTVTVATHAKWEQALDMITAYSQIVVPSATRKSITPNPKVTPLKARLIKEHADELDDPNVIAKIQDELKALDREYLKGDDSLGFLIHPKQINVARLRIGGMYGAEPDFFDETKVNVMTPSLEEGWRVQDLQLLNNTIRNGSYNRGASTALGGAEVKVTARIFQNFKILEDTDCGSKVGLRVTINDNNLMMYVGRTLVGQQKRMSIATVSNHLHRAIHIRSPIGCLSPGVSFCSTCIGDKVVESKAAISVHATTVTSSFLAAFMALMHTTELTVEHYDYKERII